MTAMLRPLLWSAILRSTTSTMKAQAVLRASEWRSLDWNREDQRRNLEMLLKWSHDSVPFWRTQLAKVGVIRAGGDVCLQAFGQIPQLTKDIIRSHGDQLVSTVPSRGRHINTSGGSTGEPVRLVQDKEFRDTVRAIAGHFSTWGHYVPGRPLLKLWGSERDVLGGESRRTRFARWLRNERWVNAFRLADEDYPGVAELWRRWKPVQVQGYVEALVDCARVLEERKLNVPPPRSIISAAGPLPDHIKDRLEATFGAPVLNRYGSREVGDVACNCGRGRGLHVSMPTHRVEVLRPDGSPTEPGEVGEIVITCLFNRSMPLIRYAIGDTGSWAEHLCECGRGWPLLEKVNGRTSDFFVRTDGSRVHGEFFTHLFYGLTWIRRFQVVQVALKHISIRIVMEGSASRTDSRTLSDTERITQDIRTVMDHDCEVSVEFVDAISPSASGKYRYTISNVEP